MSLAEELIRRVHRPQDGEWRPERFDTPRSRRRLARHVALFLSGTLLYLAGRSLHQGPDVYGMAMSLGFLLMLLAGTFLALDYPISQSASEELQRTILQAGGAGAVRTEIRIEREGVEVGRDYGFVWSDRDLLRYEGLATRFAISNSDITRAGGKLRYRLDMGSVREPLTIRFRTPLGGNARWLTGVMESWESARPERGSEILPPIYPRPPALSRLLRATLTANRNELPLGLFVAFVIGRFAGEAKSWLIPLALVAACHRFSRTFQRVREVEVGKLAQLDLGGFVPTDGEQERRRAAASAHG